MLDTKDWASYPFSVNGIDFVAYLDTHGYFYPQVERLPEGVFSQYNHEAILKLIGDPTLLTPEEIQDELDVVNLHATQAILALA